MPKRRTPRRAQQRKAWQPLAIGAPSQDYLARLAQSMRDAGVNDPEGEAPVAVAINDQYSVAVRRLRNGLRHLSIHRHDRRPVRDWRHLQQIKSEVLGPEAAAVEVFPPDSKLFDTSNEYHLWEIDAVYYRETEWASFERVIVPAHEFTQGRVRGEHKGRQRPIQSGLTSFEELP
jgi:hypothetical protein